MSSLSEISHNKQFLLVYLHLLNCPGGSPLTQTLTRQRHTCCRPQFPQMPGKGRQVEKLPASYDHLYCFCFSRLEAKQFVFRTHGGYQYDARAAETPQTRQMRGSALTLHDSPPVHRFHVRYKSMKENYIRRAGTGNRRIIICLSWL